jgi:uncharacterized protein (TIGR02246 family)
MWTTRAKSRSLLCGLLVVGAGGCGARFCTPPFDQGALAGIESLHRQDVAATAPGDPSLLAALWTEDAVRINPGGRVDVGKSAIRAADERASARHPEGRVVTYVPTIKDVRLAGEWAFEWGEFSASYQTSPTAQVTAVRGTVLRVLRKQGDGSWKFARVMVHVDEAPK